MVGKRNKILMYAVTGMALCFGLLAGNQQIARADASACSVSITPGVVKPGQDSLFDVNITNASNANIVWANILVPSAFLYSGQAISQDAWTSNEHGDGVTANNGVVAPGASYSFTVSARSTVTNGNFNWRVFASGNSDGSAPMDCSGNKTTTVSGHLPNDSNNGVSNIAFSDITSNAATITWDSDVDTTSLVYYGTTPDYGLSTKYVTGHDSSHSVTITGLTPDTLYHVQVAGQDTAVNPYYSQDMTFYTLVKTSLPAPEILALPSLSRPAIVISPSSEKIKPTVSLITAVPKIVKQVPKFNGLAEDNVAVARVDYSIDGGRNWLVAETNGLGSRRTIFSFTPLFYQDGNYLMSVRVIDTSGNSVQTPIDELVVDRMPPSFGNAVISFGSQQLTPDIHGVVSLTAGVSYQFTGQAFGGATSVTIERPRDTTKTALSLNKDTGLWVGTVKFNTTGSFDLHVAVTDGADNVSDRIVGSVQIASSGRVTDHKGTVVKNAKVSVYFLEPYRQRWVLWDASEYNQTNPQTISAKSYGFMVPPGNYYLRANAPGYGTVVSKRLTVISPQNLSVDLVVPTKRQITIGSKVLFSLPSLTRVQPGLAAITGTTKGAALGQVLPRYALPSTVSAKNSYVELLGKPSDLIVLSSWMPGVDEQLKLAQKLYKDGDITVLPLFIGENTQLIKAHLQTAGITLTGLVDEDDTYGEALRAGFGPRHIFINRSGHIKKVMFGVLSEEQIVRELGGL